MSQVDYTTFDKPQLVDFLVERDQLLEKTQRLLETIDRIVTNKNQSYSDRIQSSCLVLGHPEEVLSGQPFVLNVEEERKRSGLSNKSASTYFQAMQQSGGIEYNVEQKPKVAPDGSKVHTSESTIRFNETFDVCNTKDTAVKEKIKEDEKEKREARLQKLRTPVCPHCHTDDHISFAPIPMCMKCEVQMEEMEVIPASELCRVIEEAPTEERQQSTSVVCKECGLNQEEAAPSVRFENGTCSTCVEITARKQKVRV